MSLFGSLRMGANSLQADQIAMQVVGQNIGNANTPGYIREETVLSPAPTQQIGNLTLGLGVQVDAIVQKVDKFLQERIRGAISDQSSAESQQSIYKQLEQLINGLGDTSIGPAMTTFFNSISEVLNQPEDVSTRNLAILNAKSLTQEIRSLRSRVAVVRSDVNDRVKSMGDEINHLTDTIGKLNVQIAEVEGGSTTKSDAVGLRDRREQALASLAKLVNIRVKESPTGSTTVYVGGDFLVADGIVRPVEVTTSSDRGLDVASIELVDSKSQLQTTSGELYGDVKCRDQVLGGFLDNLDDFAGTLAFEFNKVFASGQGLHGYNELTSQAVATSNKMPLDNAGLKFKPVNGTFQVLIYDSDAKTTQTVTIPVHLLGDETDTTLESLAASLRQTGLLDAQATDNGNLTISRLSTNKQFSFANDTSGVLAALGVNTLFTGSTANDLGVNEAVADDPGLFAASTGGIGHDTANAVVLAQFASQPIASRKGESISAIYDGIVAEATQGSTVAQATAESAQTFESTLAGQALAISGVSIDEETVNMIAIQKSFQASARYISTIVEMLDILTKL
jgi:flagellar hook-associated protein 1